MALLDAAPGVDEGQALPDMVVEEVEDKVKGGCEAKEDEDEDNQRLGRVGAAVVEEGVGNLQGRAVAGTDSTESRCCSNKSLIISMLYLGRRFACCLGHVRGCT